MQSCKSHPGTLYSCITAEDQTSACCTEIGHRASKISTENFYSICESIFSRSPECLCSTRRGAGRVSGIWSFAEEGWKRSARQAAVWFHSTPHTFLTSFSHHQLCFSSQNHGMAWVEKDHNDHRVSTPLLCAGSPTTRPGCPEPHPAWPWMPPGKGGISP